MRSRNIKPGFFHNEDLVECEPLGRLLFAGLWCYADREGRFEWRPKKIKLEVLPEDDCDIDKLLAELLQRQLIRGYVINGNKYGYIPKFESHQKPHVREAKSILPAPTQDEPRLDLGNGEAQPRRPDSLIPDSLIPDKKIYKRKVPLPKDYKLTDEHIEYATSKGVSRSIIEDAFEAFCIHHRKVGSKWTDWHATWQTWIRKKIEFNKGSPIQPGIEYDGTAVKEMNQELEKITPELRAKNKAMIAELAGGATKKI